MITIDHQGSLVSVGVLGEFTLADYREFEELVDYKIRFEGPIDLFFDLREMAGFTVDVAWEDIKFARSHANDFRRIAVISNSEWLSWSAWLNQVFVNADVRVFADPEDGLAWIKEPV